MRAFVQEGSQEAFAFLVERHLPMVHRTAWRLLSGDSHRANDVSQQVFLRLATQASRLTEHTVLAGWLYRTAHHVACEVMRAENRRRRREALAMVDLDEAPEEVVATDSEAIRDVLDRELAALSAKDRQVLVERFFYDRPFTAVGRGLGVSEDAARMRVTRALDRLRRRLAKRGLKTTGAALGSLMTADAATAAPAGLAQVILGGVRAGMVGTAGGLGVLGLVGTAAVWGIALLGFGAAVHERGSWMEAQRWKAVEPAPSVVPRVVASPDSQPSVTTSAPAMAVTRFEDPMAAERAKGDAFLAEHPAVKAALIEKQRSRLLGDYGILLRELNERRPEAVDTFERLRLSLMGFHDPAVGLLQPADWLDPREVKERLTALLGYEEWERMRGMSIATPESPGGIVRRLAEKLALTETPLRAEQSHTLTQSLKTAMVVEAGKPTMDWAIGRAIAESLTEPAQWEAVAAVEAEDRYRALERAKMKTMEDGR